LYLLILGILQISHNNSSLQLFLQVDPTLVYYPFLVLKNDVVSVRSVGRIKNIDKNNIIQQPIAQQQQQQSQLSFPSSSLKRQLPTENNHESFSSSTKIQQDCVVCFDRLRDSVLIPCGHVCACIQCATDLHEKGNKQCKYNSKILLRN